MELLVSILKVYLKAGLVLGNDEVYLVEQLFFLKEGVFVIFVPGNELVAVEKVHFHADVFAQFNFF